MVIIFAFSLRFPLPLHILFQAKLGMYDKVLEQNVVKELLDAGIFLLLRFSLDDLSPPVIIAALTAMRNLLFNEPDEVSSSQIFVFSA